MIVDVSKSVVILSSAHVDIAENLQTISRTYMSVVILSSAHVDIAENLQTTLPTVRMIVDVSKSVVIPSSVQVDT